MPEDCLFFPDEIIDIRITVREPISGRALLGWQNPVHGMYRSISSLEAVKSMDEVAYYIDTFEQLLLNLSQARNNAFREREGNNKENSGT